MSERDPTSPAPRSAGLGGQKVLWLSVAALVVVLLTTWLLVPRQSAPFIYSYF